MTSMTDGPPKYSINKSKSLLGHGDSRWEQRIVAELDSALNKWVDTVPAHRAFYFGLSSANGYF